jgi:hypothetical protein
MWRIQKIVKTHVNAVKHHKSKDDKAIPRVYHNLNC